MITIYFRWLPVMANEQQAYAFPGRLPPFLRITYCTPCVYRRRTLPMRQDEREMVYIGEAEDLGIRIQRVLTPSNNPKQTNRRLRDVFDGVAAQGGSVILETAEFEEFQIEGVRFSTAELRNSFKRGVVENLLLAKEQESGRLLLNKFVDSLDKQLQKLTPSQLQRVLETVKKKANAEPSRI